MDTHTNTAAWNESERQARFENAFVEHAIATSSALLSVLSQFYRRDPEGWTHAFCVGLVALRIGEEMRLAERDLADLERAAWLHDIGRFVVQNPSDDEGGTDWTDAYRGEQVRVVYEMTRAVPFLRPAGELVVASREHIDGSGAPYGLQQEAIPLGARILHVADVCEALTSQSSSVLALSPATLNAELVRRAGSRFDVGVVAAWLRCSDAASCGLVPLLSSLERGAQA
jgi:HD-GYP domain-containing protein (c-di-GMP phosphodiesterase class II)